MFHAFSIRARVTALLEYYLTFISEYIDLIYSMNHLAMFLSLSGHLFSNTCAATIPVNDHCLLLLASVVAHQNGSTSCTSTATTNNKSGFSNIYSLYINLVKLEVFKRGPM